MTEYLVTLAMIGIVIVANGGELRMTAQIIQFRDYQIPRALAPMHGDVETSLAELKHMAAEVFNALMTETAPAEYSVPKEDPA
jgi:hypothetical protein